MISESSPKPALTYRTAGLIAIVVLFVALRIPLLISDIPNWYHSYVESNTYEVAQSMANNGHPFEQPHPSFAGYNIHGIMATPVFLLELDSRLVRLVTIAAGVAGIYFVWKIQTVLDSSLRAKLGTAALLTAMPHWVLMTGFAMPQSVTATFGIIAIYYYVLWRKRQNVVRNTVLSSLFAGLASLNHFSGLAVAATIVSLLLIDMIRSRSWILPVRSNIFFLGLMGIGNLPAVVVWYSRKSRGLLDLYEKFQFNESGEMLVTAKWWRTEIHYTAEYQPVFFLIGFALLALATNRLLRQRMAWGETGTVSQPLNSLYFWGAWFVIGLLQIPLFPGGSLIHEYYVWWAILPSAPFFVLLLERLWPGKFSIQTTVIVAVVILGVAVSVAQVSRAHGATNIPLLCRYQEC